MPGHTWQEQNLSSALIGTTPWPHITHCELKAILLLAAAGRLGGVRAFLGFFFLFLELLCGVYVLAEAGNHRVQCGSQSSQAARPRAVNYGFNSLLYGLLLSADQWEKGARSHLF